MRRERLLVVLAVIAFLCMSGEAETLSTQIIWTGSWLLVLGYCMHRLGGIQ